MAQPGTAAKMKVDIKRQHFHDYIDREQKNALRADGTADAVFRGSGDEEINFLITQNLTKEVDLLQYKIETDSVLQHGRPPEGLLIKPANIRLQKNIAVLLVE